MMYWNSDGSWGWGGWVLMIVSLVVFWGFLAWVAISLVRSSNGTEARPGSSSAEDVLAERFARGEIDQSEYEQRLGVLREQRSHSTSGR